MNKLTCFLLYILLISVAGCNNEATTTDSAVDSATIKPISTFSKEALYKELLARTQKRSKSAVADTMPLNKDLEGYTTKSLYDGIYGIHGVHGTDDRKNLYEVTDQALVNDAMSAGCIVYRDQLVSNGNGTYTLKPTGKFRDVYRVCDDEPFSSESVAAFCSGFAAGKTTFITAGHCVDSNTIKTVAIVFGYAISSANNQNPSIKEADIYFPDSIIGHSPNTSGSLNEDYCVIRVSREIPSFRFAKVRTAGKIADHEPVHVIGYPCGLPLKIAPGGAVYRNGQQNYFTTNLDTYGGNSGSPVFNSQTHTVEGILVSGGRDFQFISIDGCNRSFVCPQNIGNCTGEDVSRTSQFLKWIK